MNRILKYRWYIITLSLLFTIGISFFLRRISVDPDLKHYFPAHMESMIATDSIEKYFGSQDIIMLLFKTDDIINPVSLERVRQIDRKLRRTDGIRKTTSLFNSSRIYGEDGIMYVEPAVKKIPKSASDVASLKTQLSENEMVMNVVVADDFKSTAIIATLTQDANEDSVFASIHSILDEIPGNEKVYFGGLPFIRQSIVKDIGRDAMVLVPIALVLMIVFLYLVFREWRGVILPFLVVIMSCIISLSLIPVIGWKFYVITLLVPVMLIAVANDYGIHIIAKYQELNAQRKSMNMRSMVVYIVKDLWKPVLMTGLTTLGGIAALLAHTMIPARQMAVIAGAGIVIALLLSIFFLPAILSLMKPSKPVQSLVKEKSGGNSGFFGRFASGIMKYQRQIPYIALGGALLLSIGVFFLKVDSNEENFFPEKHPVKQASRLINAKYGGSENLSVMFEGDMLDPAVLQRIGYYENEIEKENQIDLVMSFPDVIKEISKALNDPGTQLYDTIPPTREAVAQYMELYSMSGDPEDLDQLVDFNYSRSHLLIRLTSTNNKDVDRIIARIKELTKDDPSVAAIGGYGFVRSQLADKVVRGQFYSLGIALVIVFLIISLIFKSPMAGLLSSIPLAGSIIALFGIMGATGIPLDVATALLSSLMIGVGVDYTIHFLWRYRDELKKSGSPETAVRTTLTTTGRGILFNALSVIVGFVILVISSFTPIRFFGVLVVISILSCLTGALVLLPAMVLRFRFKFLEISVEKEQKTHHDEKLLKAI